MDVLLIEDEQKIADFVIAGFAAANITTHHELDGFRGLNTALIKTFDAIVLDVGLPLLDGFQVIQEYRKKEFTTPVIMLTARTELDDLLKVFQSGADDYMPKPFFVEELIIRLHTLVQRKVGSIEKTIGQSGISLDRFTRVATYQERTVSLTQREFMLLECLMLSPGQIQNATDYCSRPFAKTHQPIQRRFRQSNSVVPCDGRGGKADFNYQ